jgi:hypothetical protein
MSAWVEAVPTLHRWLPSARWSLGAWIERIARFLRALGPYAAIELVLPGGSLLALLLWLNRHRRTSGGSIATSTEKARRGPMSLSRPAGST